MTRSSPVLAVLALAAACVSGPAPAPERARTFSATHPLPAAASIAGEAERTRLTDATIHTRLGDAARDSGNADGARAEWKQAGALLVGLGGSASPYRLVYLANGARTLLASGEHDAAARAAEKLELDPEADASAKALGARIRAAALNQMATAEVKAGRLEALNTASAERRKGKKLEPRPPAEIWKRLLDADDAYVGNARADADAGAAENAAQAAYQGGLIQYAHDNMEDAARRLWLVVESYPSSKVLGDAVNLCLQTYQVRADWAGQAAAIERAAAAVSAEARRAAAGPDKARAETVARLEEQLTREKQGLGYQAANRALVENRFKEAQAGYDAFLAAHPEHPDAPAALYNGAIAAERAGEPRKAQAARERVLARYPDARVAPKAALALADAFSKRGDHAGAAKLYALYLEKYPAGEDRCLAMLDVGIELQDARQLAEAAQRYVTYGTDARCSKEDPNRAAQLLFLAAGIHSKAGRRDEAQTAFKALVALPGVTDAAARSYVEEARSRVK